MTRVLGLAAAAALGLLPLSVWPDWRFAIAGGVAAAACAGGVLLPALGLAKAGSVLAILVFAAATMTAPAGSALPASLLMGAALLIVLDLAALRQRSQLGGLGPGVLGTHLLRLGTCVVVSAALLPALAVPAAFLPTPSGTFRPLLALAGGLIAFAGVARMFLVSHATRGGSSRA
ncbi:MAG TPA: hypothetical protein VMF62_17650 [Acetobacteraceae bacterium]|nr:hypothetical protein [Acetobacteraceae bacterium]